MFRKVSNKSLGIIFILLLLIVVVLYVTNAGKKERSFRDVLVDIDSSAVTKIEITSKANNFKPFSIFKDNEGWHVKLKNGKIASITNEKIRNTFKELMAIKPKRLAARGESKWSEFQVDSSGTRVQVFEGDNKTLDIVIGRFSYQPQPRSVSTYVRLTNDNDVYVIDGFLSLTFNQGPNSFRDSRIITGNFKKWNKLQFNYPADSSFTLVKENDKWSINGVKTDSVKTVNYLRRLSSFSRNNFADDANIGNSPTYKLTIEGEKTNPIIVAAYVDTSSYVIISNLNAGTKFNGKTFGKNIFVGKAAFFK